MKETTKTKKKVKKKFRILKITILTVLLVMLIGIVAGAGVVLAIVKTSPALDTNQILALKETSVIYDDKGNRMDDVIITDEDNQVIKRTVISLSDTAPNLGKAIIAIEDERFKDHNGVDFKGITRAAVVYIQNKIFHKSGDIQGASTLTQQLIKYRLFLANSIKDRDNPSRKIQEAYLAIQLEKALSKDDILEAYMNTIFLGGNAYGVEAASYQYFSKHAKDLTLVESAFIAGIAQSPSRFYPFGGNAKKDHSIYLNKTKTVLFKMYETGSILKKDYDDALALIKTKEIAFSQPAMSSDKYVYEYFSRPVVAQIRLDLEAKHKLTPREIDLILINGGLKIYTTMDKDLQIAAQAIIDGDKTFNKIVNTSKAPIQAAAVIFDYHNGQVKTIIGGKGTQPGNTYNRAMDTTNFPRSTGSSIKPLAVYAAAIDSKQATAATVIDDSPFSTELQNKYKTGGVPYNPKDDNTPMGLITMRTAIVSSQNLVALKLEDLISVETGYSYAQKFGLKVSTDKKGSDKNLATMALGQFAAGNTGHGQSPMLMAAAYGVFGNSGMYASQRLYTKVVDKTGVVLLDTTYTVRKAIEPASAYIMYDLLKGPVSNKPGATGGNATREVGAMPIAGKTGTATGSKDLWFCGLSPYYSAAVWIGNDDASSFSQFNSNDTAGIWGKLMKAAHTNLAVKEIAKPAGVVTATVCRDSGKAPTEYCKQDPRGNRSLQDYFVAGTEPTGECEEHIQLRINKVNSKLANENTPADLVELRVFLKSKAPTLYDDTVVQLIPPPVITPPVITPPVINPPVITPPVTDPPVTDPPPKKP